jgi:copper chaperone CopZ
LRKHFLLLPCVLILCALGLVACGGGDSDASKIEEAIETAATGTDPSKCTEVETQHFVEQSSQERGQAALKECEKEAKKGEGAAESVEVSNVEVDGSKATADVALTGGTFDSQTIEVDMIEEGGQWKANELVRFTKFDKGKFLAAIEGELGGASKGFGACVMEKFEGSSQGEIEELLWDTSSGGFDKLAKECS